MGTVINNQTGQCLCGAVRFAIIKGEIRFNALCHCRACSRARSMSPVHLIGVPESSFFVDEESKEHLVTVSGIGRMRHTNCKKCGGGVYQRPEGMDFVATFPTTYRIETANPDDPVPSGLLPEHLLPTRHFNYENRHRNHFDSLPKFKSFGRSHQMTNEGKIIND